VDSINTGIRLTKMNLMFGGVNTFIMACDQIAILWIGAGLVIDNAMTLGMFVAFSAYREQFSGRAASIIEFLLQLRIMSLHNERISDIALNEQENKKPDVPYEPQ
ncbi:TPA: colicin V synthesis protein, partial [Morganella morganii]|nr:colicin V synthesis protein [Morganella morganii]